MARVSAKRRGPRISPCVPSKFLACLPTTRVWLRDAFLLKSGGSMNARVSVRSGIGWASRNGCLPASRLWWGQDTFLHRSSRRKKASIVTSLMPPLLRLLRPQPRRLAFCWAKFRSLPHYRMRQFFFLPRLSVWRAQVPAHPSY